MLLRQPLHKSFQWSLPPRSNKDLETTEHLFDFLSQAQENMQLTLLGIGVACLTCGLGYCIIIWDLIWAAWLLAPKKPMSPAPDAMDVVRNKGPHNGLRFGMTLKSV